MNEKAIAIANHINCCVPATAQQFRIAEADHTVGPQPISTDRLYFRQAIIMGKKSLDGTSNLGNVHLGTSTVVNQQPITIGPGDTYILAPANGEKWNFADWFFAVDTDDDGLVIIYS